MRIASFIKQGRAAMIAEWIAVADAMTPRELSKDELTDAAHEILDSIVQALESQDLASRGEAAFNPTAVRTYELEIVAKAHASDRYVQRFTLKQMASEYRALRANITRRWLAQQNGELDVARELALFNAAVDASLASAIAWYDERLRQQRDALRTADRNKDEFLAVLGHELRNPLAPLRTGLDLLSRAKEEPTLLDSVRPMMERQFAHLSRLVDDLIDFARISRGDISLQKASVDLNAAIKVAVEQLTSSIAERGNDLVLQLSKSALPVLGDFDRLTQIMANLLSNPNRYMEPGGRITVTSGASDAKAIVTVVDTGFGIPQDQLGRIFDLFTQVPEHRQRTGGGGLGIGLALARRLVEMHGGSIEAKSGGLGHGSEFVFEIPILHDDARAGSADLTEKKNGPPFPLRGLVVDDNADAADSFATLLKIMGLDVRIAYDGKAALAEVEKFEPQVVFLDLGLPGMDGIDVARRIRSNPEHGVIRLFAVTGWNELDDTKSTREASFDGHLVKPVTAEQIEGTLASVPRAEGK